MTETAQEEATVDGYKGFDENWKCKGEQYAVGKENIFEGALALCDRGLHFVLNPLHAFSYYPPGKSRYAKVVARGVSTQTGDDSKRVASRLLVQAELTLKDLIDAGIKFTFSLVKFDAADKINDKEKGSAANSGYRGSAANSGDYGSAANSGVSGSAANSGVSGSAANSGDYGSAANSGVSGSAANSGDYGSAANSGYRGSAANSGVSGSAANSGYRGSAANSGYRGSAANSGVSGSAANSGYRGSAANSGKEGHAVALGIASKVKGCLGSWITCDEWKKDKAGEWHRVDAKTVKVDGKKIKADTWYMLKGGKFVEVAA